MNRCSEWLLDPELDFLNHGSFGAMPRVVFEAQREFQEALERDPIEFLAPERGLNFRLDAVRSVVGEFIGARPADVAFVRNATEGVNAVLRSFRFSQGDEILVTDHGYNACVNAARYVAQRSGAVVRVASIPFPIRSRDEVTQAIERGLSKRTRLLLIDHITSPTGLIFPISDIVEIAHRRGVRVLVDGAHGPGMVSLDLQAIGADYYTANHHKWLCGPKVSGLLWVDPRWQNEVRPTVISHAANRPQPDRSRFLCEFDWTGTFDPSPLLALPTAIKFLSEIHSGGMSALMAANREKAIAARNILIDVLDLEAPAPDEMIGSLVSLPLSQHSTMIQARVDVDALQKTLRQKHRFELPVFPGVVEDTRLLRISMQAYNRLEQVERLGEILRSLLAR